MDAMSLPPDNPAREEIIELFREYAPSLVMKTWCTGATSAGSPGGNL